MTPVLWHEILKDSVTHAPPSTLCQAYTCVVQAVALMAPHNFQAGLACQHGVALGCIQHRALLCSN